MPDFPIVDAHVHLADPKRFSYGWTKTAPSLNRTVLPEHLTKAAGPVQLARCVCVGVDVDLPQHLSEAECVDEFAKPDPRLKGVVACLPLERGKAIAGELEHLTRLMSL